jgi:hypothetical protein
MIDIKKARLTTAEHLTPSTAVFSRLSSVHTPDAGVNPISNPNGYYQPRLKAEENQL